MTTSVQCVTSGGLRNQRRAGEKIVKKRLSETAERLRRCDPDLFNSLSRRPIPWGSGEVGLSYIFDVRSTAELRRCLEDSARYFACRADSDGVPLLRRLDSFLESLTEDAGTGPHMRLLNASDRDGTTVGDCRSRVIAAIERLRPRWARGRR